MKTAIVTGVYGAIGAEIAKGLANENFRLFLIGRREEKLIQLKEEITGRYSGSDCNVYTGDLSSRVDIDRLANLIDENIDVLINNAAAAPVQRKETKIGIEMQWATNVLGYFWMIKAFKNHLLQSKDPQIINVASYWAGGLDLADPEFKNRYYNNDIAYRQSKQADRMLTYGFAKLFGKLIRVNACHPGDVNSKLSNDLGFGGSESAEKAAETPLLLARARIGANHTGTYFEHGKISQCRFSADNLAVEKLMEVCEAY